MAVGASMFGGGAPSERREARRAPVSLPVLIRSAGRQHTARLHNLSCCGAMVESAAAPARGARLVLSCGTIEADATVVWTEERTFGIRFAAPVRDAVVQQQVSRSEAVNGRLPPQA